MEHAGMRMMAYPYHNAAMRIVAIVLAVPGGVAAY
jgi:hypothetical protein